MRAGYALLVLACAASGSMPDLVQQAPIEWADKVNPMAGDSRAQRAGAKLYERECAECHGAGAQGIGKAPSLRQPHIAKAAPGALNWVIVNGAVFHGMPSFAHLPEPQRWQIVTFLRSLNTR